MQTQSVSSSIPQENLSYRGKNFSLPLLSPEGVYLKPRESVEVPPIPENSPLIADLNTIWDIHKFKTPRTPILSGTLSPEELSIFSQPGVPRVLDMPIKMPGSEVRIPKELMQFAPAIQKILDFEWTINRGSFDEYYAYLTIDQGYVEPGSLQREAPCHVDGFQGARWNPKVKINHSYTVSDALPTVYYPQPFNFSLLDEKKHNFFWEMNRQVAATDSQSAWQGSNGEILLMDAYCVHRGVEALEPTHRTWLRLSFEVRIFDRLGNAHNPMFNYDWKMVPRDIEQLGLSVFSDDGDPSLAVFPWQGLDGRALSAGEPKTKPNLRPLRLQNASTVDAISVSEKIQLKGSEVEQNPGKIVYHNPVPVSVLIVPVLGIDPSDGLEKIGVIAIRRSIEPQIGKLALPGGYLGYEDWRSGGLRELSEETRIVIDDMEAIKPFDIVSVEDGKKVVLIGLAPVIREADVPLFDKNSEASERRIIFDPEELAFPSHTEALRRYLESIRS